MKWLETQLLLALYYWGCRGEEYIPEEYNKTLAVIVEPQFMSSSYPDLLDQVRNLVMTNRQAYLKSGGLTVEFYTRPDISSRRNIAAVLSIASCENTWYLFNHAQETILHLAITEADCARLPFDEAITVPLIRGGGELSQILLDLRTARAINWKSVVLFYESAAVDRYEVQKIITSLSEKTPLGLEPASVSVFRLDGLKTEWGRRKQIYNVFTNFPVKTLGANFLVVVSRDLVGVVMEVAKSAGLVHPLSQWLYVVPDTEVDRTNITAFSAMLTEGDNVSFIYNSTANEPTCKGGPVCHVDELLKSFVVSLDRLIREEMDLSNQVSEEEWDAIKPSARDQRQSILTMMKTELKDHGKCDKCTSWVMKAGETWGKEYQSGFKNRDALSETRGKNPQTETDHLLEDLLDVGEWHPREGHVLNDILFPHVFHGFRGRQLPVITFINPPWQILKYNETGHFIGHGGLIFEILEELSRSLNFTYEVRYSGREVRRVVSNDTNDKDNLNNTQDASTIAANWDRMMQEVRQKEVFLGAGAFIITAERKRIINFTVPIGIEPYTFLVARPQELSRALLFLSPFAGDTWLCIAVAIAVMGPLLNWFHRITPYYDYLNTRTTGGLQTVTNCLWYVYGALLQQGGIHLPMADSGRLIIGTWWLFVLVIVTTYSGNLVAFLTFPKIDSPITSLDELLTRKGSVSWGIISGSPVDVRLRGNTDPKYRTLYEEAEIHPREDPAVINRVRQGEHVFIDWKTNLLFLMKKEFKATGRCDFSLATEEFLDEQVAMIVAQESPYLPRIDEEIRRIHRVGLIRKWLDEYLPKKDKCSSANRMNEVNSHTVNMRDMQGSFFVLFLGFILSVFVILAECVYRKKKMIHEKTVIKPFAS